MKVATSSCTERFDRKDGAVVASESERDGGALKALADADARTQRRGPMKRSASLRRAVRAQHGDAVGAIIAMTVDIQRVSKGR